MRWWPAVVIVATSSTVVAGAPDWRPRPSSHIAPKREVRGLGTTSSDACASCHPAIAEEWRASLHRDAYANPVFQRSFAVEPEAFCQGCHAPEAAKDAPPDAQAAADGVSCLSCHVDAGAVHGTTGSGSAAHASVKAAWMAGVEACAGCHQFEFPHADTMASPTPMQNTVAEHAASDVAETPCQSCHMPLVDGHRSHAFHVQGNAELLAQAIRVEARREGRHVRLALASGLVGHAFPTGDLFRRVELRAEAVDVDGAVVARARPVVLSRRFERVTSPSGRVTTVEGADTRLGPPGTPGDTAAYVLRLPRYPRTATLVWQVVYQRVGAKIAGRSDVVEEIVIAKGTLSP